jgi:hypothetical protein
MTSVLRTDQVAPHADLVKVVQHHQQNPWRKPCPQHTQVAFEQFLARYQSQPRPLILDSFCGTGMSTALLAEKHPISGWWVSTSLRTDSPSIRIPSRRIAFSYGQKPNLFGSV